MTERPLPVRDELNRHYWDGARQEKLVLLRCTRCRSYVHPPRGFCPSCGQERLEPSAVSGKGRVYSWSVMHAGGNPGFDDKLPYVVVVVELDEQPGLRTIGNLLGASAAELAVGRAVEVCFEKVTEDVTLPQWRLAAEAR
ncbi:MAG TPA: OB-fold domain-containing protein [Acidimicrobiales bacterium]|nr:OB-fold domain-containing protein [Acidimicrobiales bacterium]